MPVAAFKTIGDFQRAYGPKWGELAYKAVFKADDPLLTSSSGNYATHYGAGLWAQMNTEYNFYSILPKVPWGGANKEDGWRVITDFPADMAMGVGQDGVIPDDVMAAFAKLYTLPADVVTPFSESLRAYSVGNRGQGITWRDVVAFMTITHKKGVSRMLAKGAAETYTNEFIPIDRIVSGFSEVNSCAGDYRGNAFGGTDPDVYGIDRHTMASWADSNVVHNSGVLRVLNVALLYEALRITAKAIGKQPTGAGGYVFLTGYDTVEALAKLFQVMQMYTTIDFKTSSVNGVSTVAGQDTGMMVQAFNQVPIVGVDDIGSQPGGLSPIYLINHQYLKFWVDIPTVYREVGVLQGNELLLGKLSEKGMYHTAGQVACHWFKAQTKIRDIKAS